MSSTPETRENIIWVELNVWFIALQEPNLTNEILNDAKKQVCLQNQILKFEDPAL